jgi:hypothetical protein
MFPIGPKREKRAMRWILSDTASEGDSECPRRYVRSLRNSIKFTLEFHWRALIAANKGAKKYSKGR